jgi:hypothetical protein
VRYPCWQAVSLRQPLHSHNTHRAKAGTREVLFAGNSASYSCFLPASRASAPKAHARIRNPSSSTNQSTAAETAAAVAATSASLNSVALVCGGLPDCVLLPPCPLQTGTSDTVEMLGEEEVWEVESSRELVPLGWIHTHPTQVHTCVPPGRDNTVQRLDQFHRVVGDRRGSECAVLRCTHSWQCLTSTSGLTLPCCSRCKGNETALLLCVSRRRASSAAWTSTRSVATRPCWRRQLRL